MDQMQRYEICMLCAKRISVPFLRESCSGKILLRCPSCSGIFYVLYGDDSIPGRRAAPKNGKGCTKRKAVVEDFCPQQDDDPPTFYAPPQQQQQQQQQQIPAQQQQQRAQQQQQPSQPQQTSQLLAQHKFQQSQQQHPAQSQTLNQHMQAQQMQMQQPKNMQQYSEPMQVGDNFFYSDPQCGAKRQMTTFQMAATGSSINAQSPLLPSLLDSPTTPQLTENDAEKNRAPTWVPFQRGSSLQMISKQAADILNTHMAPEAYKKITKQQLSEIFEDYNRKGIIIALLQRSPLMQLYFKFTAAAGLMSGPSSSSSLAGNNEEALGAGNSSFSVPNLQDPNLAHVGN
jgi:hypothetical protein